MSKYLLLLVCLTAADVSGEEIFPYRWGTLPAQQEIYQIDGDVRRATGLAVYSTNTTNDGETNNKTGIAAISYNTPDNGQGEASAVFGLQTGGGNAASFYHVQELRNPLLSEYWGYGNALEAGTTGPGNGLLVRAGIQGFHEVLGLGENINPSQGISVTLENKESKGLLIDCTHQDNEAIAIGDYWVNSENANKVLEADCSGNLRAKSLALDTPLENNVGNIKGYLRITVQGTNGPEDAYIPVYEPAPVSWWSRVFR